MLLFFKVKKENKNKEKFCRKLPKVVSARVTCCPSIALFHWAPSSGIATKHFIIFNNKI